MVTVGVFDYSQLDHNGARFDFIHLHKGKTLGTGELLLGLVVFEFKENSSPYKTKQKTVLPIRQFPQQFGLK